MSWRKDANYPLNGHSKEKFGHVFKFVIISGNVAVISGHFIIFILVLEYLQMA